MQHRSVGTEDILWSLFHEDEQQQSRAIRLLEKRGISRVSVYANFQYSDNAAAILKLAAERAHEQEHEYIGTEDLLHALFSSSHSKSRSLAVDRLFQRGVTEALVFGKAELSNNARLVSASRWRTALQTCLGNGSFEGSCRRES